MSDKPRRVLVAVELYDRDGQGWCQCDHEEGTFACTFEVLGEACWLLDGRRFPHEEVFGRKPCFPDCPLRAPEALTVDEVLEAMAGPPRVPVDFVVNKGVVCRECRGNGKHTKACSVGLATAEYACTLAKLRAMAGEE